MLSSLQQLVAGGLAMTGSGDMRKLIVQAYKARDEGHADELMSAFHADAVFRLAGDKKVVAVADTIEGHGNIRGAMRGFIEKFEFRGREIISMIFDGDRAAVHSRINVRHRGDPEAYTTDILDLFTFRDGKIVELVEFADTALINRMTASAPPVA
jgi:ketosteroid isomerase-like protein